MQNAKFATIDDLVLEVRCCCFTAAPTATLINAVAGGNFIWIPKIYNLFSFLLPFYHPSVPRPVRLLFLLVLRRRLRFLVNMFVVAAERWLLTSLQMNTRVEHVRYRIA